MGNAEALACPCCVRRDREPAYDGNLGVGVPPYGGSFSYAGSYDGYSVPGTPQASRIAPHGQGCGVSGFSTGPCIRCKEEGANTLCIPCGHLLLCFRCSLGYTMPDGTLHPDMRCPVCKQQVLYFQRALPQSPAALARQLQHAESFHSGVGSSAALHSRQALPRSVSHRRQ